jgi:hypothetical protein
MRRSFYGIVIAVFLLAGITLGDNVFIYGTSNYLIPADKDFKDIYGKGLFYPEIKAGVKVFEGFYVWAGYGFLLAKGTTTLLAEEAESNQNYFSGGFGYEGRISDRVGYRVETGTFYVNYREEAMGLEVSGSAIGYRIDGGLNMDVLKNVYIEISGGYLAASDSIEGISIKLGGFKTGVGFGVRF